jgi:hypothetical protein
VFTFQLMPMWGRPAQGPSDARRPDTYTVIVKGTDDSVQKGDMAGVGLMLAPQAQLLSVEPLVATQQEAASHTFRGDWKLTYRSERGTRPASLTQKRLLRLGDRKCGIFPGVNPQKAAVQPFCLRCADLGHSSSRCRAPATKTVDWSAKAQTLAIPLISVVHRQHGGQTRGQPAPPPRFASRPTPRPGETAWQSVAHPSSGLPMPGQPVPSGAVHAGNSTGAAEAAHAWSNVAAGEAADAANNAEAQAEEADRAWRLWNEGEAARTAEARAEEDRACSQPWDGEEAAGARSNEADDEGSAVSRATASARPGRAGKPDTATSERMVPHGTGGRALEDHSAPTATVAAAPAHQSRLVTPSFSTNPFQALADDEEDEDTEEDPDVQAREPPPALRVHNAEGVSARPEEAAPAEDDSGWSDQDSASMPSRHKGQGTTAASASGSGMATPDGRHSGTATRGQRTRRTGRSDHSPSSESSPSREDRVRHTKTRRLRELSPDDMQDDERLPAQDAPTAAIHNAGAPHTRAPDSRRNPVATPRPTTLRTGTGPATDDSSNAPAGNTVGLASTTPEPPPVPSTPAPARRQRSSDPPPARLNGPPVVLARAAADDPPAPSTQRDVARTVTGAAAPPPPPPLR